MSRSDSRTSLSHKAINERRKGGCFLVAFFSVFLIAGLGFSYVFLVRPMWKLTVSQNWPEAPCTILKSEVEENRDSDGSTYRVDISFRYRFNNKEYTSESYDFFLSEISSGGANSKREIVRQHPPGRETVCYVNPHWPQEAVLSREFHWEMLFGLMPLIFVAVGLGGVLFASGVVGTKVSTSTSGSTAHTGLTASAAPPTSEGWKYRTGDEGTDPHEGPVTLEPETSRLGRLIAAFFFAAFWNGITSVFLYQVVGEWRQGKTPIFLTLFLTPFVLVGIGLICWIVYAFLSLFLPRPILSVDRARIPLGASTLLGWQFAGYSGAIRQFKIVLKGEEKATYRRGTDTHTDEYTFHEEVLLDTHDPLEMYEGELEVWIPTDSMHSFESDHNKIVWTIEVTGEIPFSPDVNETFPFTVVPHELHQH
ncbi:hypothetical protein Mal4_12300 [Maioricimonas rarisocia]|uniref:DUF3592 domain-containing protein n=1 Tax=Maioricimonas rarisocia TaxID=2528026 RepID=A0A517Z375_9PLAN|nr:DUF3592 domain-containing protein [Maioricimonas rarisocia]QDU36929.1 hypothetical protein Mal4_12300 [Maioricimonas rarisocia]